MGLKQYEADQFIKTSGTSSQYLMADGSTSTGPSGGVDVGTGTANKIPKFSDSDTITDGIMTDDGTSVLVDGNLAIGTADNDNLFHIEATDTTYDVSRAFEIDYTKNHSTTGWGASAFGVRSNVYVEGTGQNSDLQGGSFGATHNGSGITYYLLGSQSNAKHQGSGNTGAIWGAYNRGLVSGTGTGTHPFLIGTNQVAELNNANASVGKMQSIVAYAKTTAGDITTRVVGAEIGLDCNQGSTTTVDAAVLHLEANTSNLTVSGNARTINSVSTLPSFFSGTIEAPKFYIGSTEVNYLEEDGNGVTNLFGDAGIMIETSDGAQIDISDVVVVNTQLEAQSLVKTGGTSSQFLKADGSVDSNTYAVGTIPTDFVSAASGGTFSGSLTIDTDTDTILKLNNSDNGPQYVTFARSNDRHAYFGFGGSSDNFTIMSEETGGQLLLGTAAATRMTIDSDGHVGINETSPQEELHVTGRAIISDRLAVGGNFTPQKALHMKNAAPVFRMEDSDTAGYAEFLKSSSNFTFRVDPTGVEASSELRFQVDGNELMTVREDGVGFGDITPTEMVDVNGNVKADSFIKDGGTSSQFLKADGSVDSTSYTTGAHPTDFVSAASGGSFGGGIVADSFTITGLSSGDSFLKANGSLDGTTYNSGTGASGGIAIYNGTNTTTDDSNLQYNFLNSTLTSRNIDVSVDLNVGGDVDVTGNLEAEYVTATGFKNQQIILTSNFTHTSTTTGYYSMPFGSLGESISTGEQHYFVSPGNYRLRTIILKNTSTGTAPTITANNFRVVKNGTTLWTGSSNLFGSGSGAYSSNGLTDSQATWNTGDMIQFQFNPTGLWRDVAATMVLELV